MDTAPSWYPLVSDPEQRERALDLAVSCGSLLCKPDAISVAQELIRLQTRFPHVTPYSPLELASGNTGIALTCGQLAICFPDSGWDSAAQEHLRIAVKALERQRPPIGLFSGLSGLAFTTWILSRNGSRYRTLLHELDDALSSALFELLNSTDHLNGLPFGVFDLVSGWSGIAAYLLLRRDRPDFQFALDSLLNELISLFCDGQNPPKWFTPSHLCADPRMAAQFPEGTLNCGMAHGAPGALTVLALALEQSNHVQGIEEAVRFISDWLVSQQMRDAFGPNWPATVALGSSGYPRIHSRAAWCYGSPGVARSLFLAGRALNAPDLTRLGIVAMEAVFNRSESQWDILSPSFCHGLSGILAVAARFANEVSSDVIDRGIERLVRSIVEKFEPDRPFGFRDEESPGIFVDRPGLLEGTAGIVLTLLASTTNFPPQWDRIFLIS